MSLAIIYSRAQSGIDSPLVTVETHLSLGMPGCAIVGLPEKAVKESRDRVRSALINNHFEFPISRMTINLAPADLPKDGGRFDLPMALGILAASDQIPEHSLNEYEFVGELALSGELRPIQGALPFALKTKAANRKLILPYANADEASLVNDLTVLPANHITDVYDFLCGRKKITPYKTKTINANHYYSIDLSDVQGQQQAKRSLEIAACGEHSLLFIGPPGTGKTMLASRLPTILPPMNDQEATESAAIFSISHKGFNHHHWKKRSFRSPHHSASSVALVGGGNPPRPGEISLAHNGILFLDELPEFSRHVLEALREPIESGSITISRAARQAEFPANFQLIAAMNPCPCGYLGDEDHNCRCTAEQVQRYHARISGPMLDRIDMHVDVARISPDLLAQKNKQQIESSTTIRQRVETARQIQINRANKCNAKLTVKEIEKHCSLKEKEQTLLTKAIQKLKLSARSYHRILKVARTIADLEGIDEISTLHLSEAIGYRKID